MGWEVGEVISDQLSVISGRVYLIQTPTNLTDAGNILIYFHGANNDENQAMHRFKPLCELAKERGWLLVSPRDYEIDGLLKDLETRYGKRRVCLIGASAGGGYVYRCATKKPEAYAGIFLLGPAMWVEPDDPVPFSIPTYLVYGNKDGGNTKMARLLLEKMEEEQKPIKYREIDGGHNAPYPDQFWWQEAMEFVLGERSSEGQGKDESKPFIYERVPKEFERVFLSSVARIDSEAAPLPVSPLLEGRGAAFGSIGREEGYTYSFAYCRPVVKASELPVGTVTFEAAQPELWKDMHASIIMRDTEEKEFVIWVNGFDGAPTRMPERVYPEG